MSHSGPTSAIASGVCLVLVGSLACSALRASEAGATAPVADLPHHTEKQRVSLVLLQASVTDGRGRPVLGLQSEQFSLREDGVSQRIDFVTAETSAPIALAFLLDVSGSMRQIGKLDEAKRAIHRIVGTLEPQDRFGLICFADSQVTWITDFTSDAERFGMRLDVQEAFGQTALYDALAATPSLVDEGIEGRKAIVLFTDGIDTASKLPMLRAMWLARRVSVPIYTMSFVLGPEKIVPRRVRGSLEVLGRFSDETGGALFAIHKPRDLDRATAQIQRELRHQYLIGYYPDDRGWDGAFRHVALETDQPKLRVRTRTGYYADP